MYRLMIVDDDEILREGLIKNINWNQNEIEVVTSAKNGKEAMEKIQKYMPEIILSDIRMPFMDGIELSKWVYEHCPQVKIMLLSAYEEFEYAKKAIQYHVSDYVMKYESNETILQKVKQMIVEYEIDKRHKEMIEMNQDYLLKEFILQLCFNQFEENEIEENLQRICPDFIRGKYRILSLQIEMYNSKREMKLIKLAGAQKITAIIIAYLKDLKFKVLAFQDKENIKLFLTYFELDFLSDEEFQKVLESTVLEIESCNPVHILAGGGGFYTDLIDVNKSYLEAEEAMNTLKLVNSKGTLVKSFTRVMINGVSKNKQDTMAETMERIVAHIKEHYSDADLSLHSIAKQVYLSPNYISSLFKKYLDVNISNYIIDVRMKQAEILLRESSYKAYEIANMVGYTNAQYFSILFKRSTGLSPSDYRSKFDLGCEST